MAPHVAEYMVSHSKLDMNCIIHVLTTDNILYCACEQHSADEGSACVSGCLGRHDKNTYLAGTRNETVCVNMVTNVR